MEVMPSYKQTEVGVIPEDWGSSSLLAIADCLDNLRIPLNDAQRQRMQGDVPYCGANGVLDYVNDFVIDDDIILMAEDGGYFDQYASRPIAYRMQGKCWVNNHAHILRAKRGHDQGFLFYSLVHKNILSFIASGTRAKLNKSEMEKILVATPPTEAEQRAIATALTDVDDLLTSLDRLIAKKRAIKQGVMHDLLTGRKRLPGFGGKWREVSIGELANVDPEVLPQATDPNYEFNYIALEDVTRGTLRSFQRLRFATAPSRARRILRYHDILIGTVRPNLQSHLLHVRRESSWICSTGFSVVRCDPSHAWPDFVFHSFFGMNLNNQIATLIAGSNYPAISRRDVAALTIPTPPLHEQRAIGTVLTDLDDEIDALQARRDKTHAIKQAMMHELLTGRTRLV